MLILNLFYFSNFPPYFLLIFTSMGLFDPFWGLRPVKRPVGTPHL